MESDYSILCKVQRKENGYNAKPFGNKHQRAHNGCPKDTIDRKRQWKYECKVTRCQTRHELLMSLRSIFEDFTLFPVKVEGVSSRIGNLDILINEGSVTIQVPNNILVEVFPYLDYGHVLFIPYNTLNNRTAMYPENLSREQREELCRISKGTPKAGILLTWQSKHFIETKVFTPEETKEWKENVEKQILTDQTKNNRKRSKNNQSQE